MAFKAFIRTATDPPVRKGLEPVFISQNDHLGGEFSAALAQKIAIGVSLVLNTIQKPAKWSETFFRKRVMSDN